MSDVSPSRTTFLPTVTPHDDPASADTHAEDRVQLILDIPAARLDELDALRAALGTPDFTGMLNMALSLAQWMVTQRSQGRVVASVDETAGSYTELKFPGA